MVLFLGMGPSFVNPGVCPTGQHLDSHLEEASSQLSASILPSGALPLSGSCSLGRGTALAIVTTSPISQESVFLFTFLNFFGEKNFTFLQRVWFLIFVYC